MNRIRMLGSCVLVFAVASSIPPASAIESAPIRPGEPLLYEIGVPPALIAGCSMGFLLTDRADVYVSTAGHCVSAYGGVGGRARAAGIPGTFGTVVYHRCAPACDAGRDFALIRIDPDKTTLASPAMVGWGAPKSVFGGTIDTPTLVHHAGAGLVFGGALLAVDRDEGAVAPTNPATCARTGLAIPVDFALHRAIEPHFGRDGDYLPFDLVRASAAPADSGSGVLIHGGAALGLFSTQIPTGAIAVERLDANIAASGLSLELWAG